MVVGHAIDVAEERLRRVHQASLLRHSAHLLRLRIRPYAHVLCTEALVLPALGAYHLVELLVFRTQPLVLATQGAYHLMELLILRKHTRVLAYAVSRIEPHRGAACTGAYFRHSRLQRRTCPVA